MQAINFLNDILASGDTIEYSHVDGQEVNGHFIQKYVVTVSGENISQALAEACQGLLVNGRFDPQIGVIYDKGVACVSGATDARTMTILLGEALGRPAHLHFNFKIR